MSTYQTAFHNPQEDDGCHVHPHCLSCPLPACIYDDLPAWKRQQDMAIATRDTAVLADLAAGLMIKEVAERHGIGRRTVARIKAGSTAAR